MSKKASKKGGSKTKKKQTPRHSQSPGQREEHASPAEESPEIVESVSAEEAQQKAEALLAAVEQLSVDDSQVPDVVNADMIVNYLHKYFPPEMRTIIRGNQFINNDDELRDSVLLHDDGLDVIRRFMDKYPGKFKVCGTPEEVCEQLRAYRIFPGSHMYFNIDYRHPYSESYSFIDHNGETLIQKQDTYAFLNVYITRSWPEMPELARQVITTFFKILEERIHNYHEFALFDEMVPLGEIDSILERIWDVMANHRETIVAMELNPPDVDFEEICQQWRNMLIQIDPEEDLVEPRKNDGINVIWTVERFEPIRRVLKSYCQRFPPREYKEQYAESLYVVSDMLQFLWENIGLSYCHLPQELVTAKTWFIRLRKFKVNKVSVMMRSEAYQTYGIRNKLESYTSEQNEPILSGAFINDIQKQFDIEMNGNILVHVPIVDNQTMKAVPIKSPFNGYCLYAASAIKQILRRVISSFKIFQRVEKGCHADDIMRQLFWIFNEYFRLEATNPYFVTMEVVENVERLCGNIYKEVIKPGAVIPVESRDIPSHGRYTLTQLKQQMDDMKLGFAFQNIKQKAEKAMKHVEEGKWTTRKLHDILARCQASCFLDKFSKLRESLHYQCVPHEPCPLCDKHGRSKMADYLTEL